MRLALYFESWLRALVTPSHRMQVGRKRKVGRDCETVTVNESVGQVETAVGVVMLGCGCDYGF
jgi:hypothetical protein